MKNKTDENLDKCFRFSMSQESDGIELPRSDDGSLVQDFIDMDKFNRSGNFKKLITQIAGPTQIEIPGSSSQPRKTELILEQDESSSVLPANISSWKSQPGIDLHQDIDSPRLSRKLQNSSMHIYQNINIQDQTRMDLGTRNSIERSSRHRSQQNIAQILIQDESHSDTQGQIVGDPEPSQGQHSYDMHKANSLPGPTDEYTNNEQDHQYVKLVQIDHEPEEKKFEMDSEIDEDQKQLISSFLASIQLPDATIKIDSTDNGQEEFQIDVGDNGQVEAEEEVQIQKQSSVLEIQMEDQKPKQNKVEKKINQQKLDGQIKKMREKFYYLQKVKPMMQNSRGLAAFKSQQTFAKNLEEKSEQKNLNRSLSPSHQGGTLSNSTPRLDAQKVKNLNIAHYFKEDIPAEFCNAMNSKKTMEILGELEQPKISCSIFHKDKLGLQKEMINANAVLEFNSQKISPIRGGTKQISEMEMTRNMNDKQKKQVKQRKWGKIIKDLEKNPQHLMEIIPTPKNKLPYNDTLHTCNFESKKRGGGSLLSTLQQKITLSSKNLGKQQSTVDSQDPYGDIAKPQQSLFSNGSGSRPEFDPYGSNRYMNLRNNSSNSQRILPNLKPLPPRNLKNDTAGAPSTLTILNEKLSVSQMMPQSQKQFKKWVSASGEQPEFNFKKMEEHYKNYQVDAYQMRSTTALGQRLRNTSEQPLLRNTSEQPSMRNTSSGIFNKISRNEAIDLKQNMMQTPDNDFLLSSNFAPNADLITNVPNQDLLKLKNLKVLKKEKKSRHQTPLPVVQPTEPVNQNPLESHGTMLSNNYRAIQRKNNVSLEQKAIKNILNKKRDSLGSKSNFPSVKTSQKSNLIMKKKQENSLGPVLSGGNLKIPHDLKVLDFSVRKLQESSQAKFSNYELTNQREILKKVQIEQKVQEQKKEQIKNFNLSNELLKNFKDKQAEITAATRFKNQFKNCSMEFKIIDWNSSNFFKNVSEGIETWNHGNEPNVLSEEQLEYTINLLRYCAKDFPLEKLMPVFTKATATLKYLMEEMQIPFLFYRIVNQLNAITIESTLKLLVRGKLLLPCRYKLIKIFKAVKDHEQKLQELNNSVMKGDQELELDDDDLKQSQTEKRNRMIKTKISELEHSTKLVTSLIDRLLEERKIFGTRFIFDGMDYLEVIQQELSQIKEIIEIYNRKAAKIQEEKLAKYLAKNKPIVEEVEEDFDTPSQSYDKSKQI